MRRLFLWFLFLAAAAAGGAWLYISQPMVWDGPAKEFTLPPGSTARSAAKLMAQEGVPIHPRVFAWYAQLTGKAGQIKAGSYRIESGIQLPTLLMRLVRGDFVEYTLTIFEGWNVHLLRRAIADNVALEDDISKLSDAELLTLVGASETHLEGLFFPDTYRFAKYSKASLVLKRAYQIQQEKLAQAWENRAADLPLESAYDALILASIVEKETGVAGDRARIAAVFINRLRKGMMLQTDPTVIYGLGQKFDGNLRKRDLLTDNPYNTYTRAGLPPTPISLPGTAALNATLHPAQTDDLFFVGRGDGSSFFSATLDEHNSAVDKYQRKRK
ncbi:MAG: endolytic transglycosylase MltG [Burkholderiaceae bacterium]|nr:MAG: endolytic transglycosylase MltG [Burkholderiaceae bacterium]